MNCLCYSNTPYESCCKPYHVGQLLPSMPLQLMRSRYSAYANALADYIIETTHPSSPHYQIDQEAWKGQILAFSKATDFTGLSILHHEHQGLHGVVTFKAHLMQGEQDVSFKEKSEFLKDNNRWYYLSGVHE